MGVGYNPKIVTDGLVLALDAGNNKSFPVGPSYSNYFDGSGDYLTLPTNAALTMGTGAFTLEAWVWFSSGTNGGVISGLYDNGTSLIGVGIILLGGSLRFEAGTNSTQSWRISTSSFRTNQWNHVVGVRDASGNVAFFLNGTRVGTTNNSVNITVNSFVVGSYFYDNPGRYPLTGYLSNVRVVKGTAVYDPTQSTLTVPTSPLIAITNTSLLTCQSATFIDNSTNNFTITPNGNVSVQSFNPFGASFSNYFDGNGDFLSIPANTALNITGGAFTIELWAFTNVSGSTQMFVAQDDGASSGQSFQFRVSSTNTVEFIYWTTSSRSSAVTLSTTANFIVGSWNHVAVSYTGSVLRIYINGVQRASSSVGSMFSANLVTAIGHYNTTLYGEHFTGYISNVRIVKGTALYTSDFTPTTTPLTAITNTSLLTCQSANLIDTSTNNFTITKNGDVLVQKFTPFAGNFPTSSAWTDLSGNGNNGTLINGASFDSTNGNGITFSGVDEAVSTFASSTLGKSINYTTSAWIRYSNVGYTSWMMIVDSVNYGNGGGYMMWLDSSSPNTGKYLGSYDGNWQFGTIPLLPNQWYNVAITKTNNQVSFYINGNFDVTRTYNFNTNTSTATVAIGWSGGNSGYPFNGKISNVLIHNRALSAAEIRQNFNAQRGRYGI